MCINSEQRSLVQLCTMYSYNVVKTENKAIDVLTDV